MSRVPAKGATAQTLVAILAIKAVSCWETLHNMQMNMIRTLTPARQLIVCSLILVGCAARTPAPIEEREIGRDLAGEVRQQTADQHAPIEVFALSDPGGLLLLEQAREAEQSGQLDKAQRLVLEAIELTPDDPEYWQYLAELKLQASDYSAAIEHAQHSFELGPQIGPLCYRNWLTQQHAHDAMNATIAAAKAAGRAEICLAVRVDS